MHHSIAISMLKRTVSLTAVALVLGWAAFAAGCGSNNDHAGHDHGDHSKDAHDDGAPGDAKAKPYTLKDCVVSGEKLGSMGKVKRIVHEGQEIKFCCPHCEKDFRKDPAKYMKSKMDIDMGGQPV